MIRLHLVVEGQTELLFADRLLAPWLAHRGVYLRSHMPGSLGGDLRYARIKRDVLGLLRNDRSAAVSTMFDLYRLPNSFPGMELALPAKLATKASAIEAAFADDIAAELGSGFLRSRFVPYIQVHEFEAVLFSAPGLLAAALEAPELAQAFEQIRAKVATPEEINEGEETAPSKRIIRLFKPYEEEKPALALRAASLIGLATMRAECPHFHAWLSKLEALSTMPSSSGGEVKS